MTSARQRGSRAGYILVSVLGIMVVLTSVLAAGSVLTRSALHASRVDDDAIAMTGLTDGGLELTAYQVFVLNLPPSLVNGRRIKFAGGTVRPDITDEAGKADLNGSDVKLLQSELEAAGLDRAAARAVVARIVALRGPDAKNAPQGSPQEPAGFTPPPIPGGYGAPPPVTSASGAPPAPRPRGFESVDALRAFPEIGRVAYRMVAARFTVFNPDGRIAIATAAPDVLMGIPGMDKATLDRILAGRIDAPKAEVEKLAASLGPAQDFTKAVGGPAYTVRIDAVAADGHKKSVGAVMAAAKSPNVPYYVLEWQD